MWDQSALPSLAQACRQSAHPCRPITRDLGSNGNSCHRDPHRPCTQMQQANPSGTPCEEVAGIISLWLESKKPIHWIIPNNSARIPPHYWREGHRISFRVQPQFRESLSFALTCRNAHRQQCWHELQNRRWKELEKNLRQLLKLQIKGTIPVALSDGTAVFLAGNNRRQPTIA